MRPTSEWLLAATTIALLATPADARDRSYVPLDRELAAERVLQLSPQAGVAVEYRGGYGHPQGQVVFHGNIPVGITGPGGVVYPLGGTDRVRPHTVLVVPQPAAVAVPVHRVAVVPAQTRHVAVHPGHSLDPVYLPQTVRYETRHAPGTIVIDTRTKFLYLVEHGGHATRYGVGVGKEGFGWRGTERVTRKAEWPGWTPPREMIARERAKGIVLPAHMAGGPENPLGARALYLGSTLYRIHGTNQPWTIGTAVSSGCIRMRNEDVIDLYGRVPVGATVVVL